MQIRRPSELGAIINTARRARGLTQGDLADRLGVSRVWLGQIERGKPSARIDLVFRVLNELQITLAAYPNDERTDSAPSASAAQDSAFDIDAIADTGLLTPPDRGSGKSRSRR